jgi:hypothetical protein
MIDQDDHRCARQFRLDRLRFAYRLCMSDYRSCPVYHQICRERATVHEPDAAPIFDLTVHGRSLGPGALRQARPRAISA